MRRVASDAAQALGRNFYLRREENRLAYVLPVEVAAIDRVAPELVEGAQRVT